MFRVSLRGHRRSPPRRGTWRAGLSEEMARVLRARAQRVADQARMED